MSGKIQEDELDIATAEFITTFNDFKKAAKKLMAVMDRIREKNYQELSALPEGSEQTHGFLIQMMDDSGKVTENCFDIEYVAEEEKRQG